MRRYHCTLVRNLRQGSWHNAQLLSHITGDIKNRARRLLGRLPRKGTNQILLKLREVLVRCVRERWFRGHVVVSTVEGQSTRPRTDRITAAQLPCPLSKPVHDRPWIERFGVVGIDEIDPLLFAETKVGRDKACITPFGAKAFALNNQFLEDRFQVRVIPAQRVICESTQCLF